MIANAIAFAVVIAFGSTIGLLFDRGRRRSERRDRGVTPRHITVLKWTFCGLTLLWLLIGWELAESGHDGAAFVALLASSPSFVATIYFARRGRAQGAN